MELEELLAKANDSITVGRVFGTPIERDGVLVVRDGRVEWVPALDYARFASAAAAVVIVALLARRSIVKSRAHRARRR